MDFYLYLSTTAYIIANFLCCVNETLLKPKNAETKYVPNYFSFNGYSISKSRAPVNMDIDQFDNFRNLVVFSITSKFQRMASFDEDRFR